MSVIRVCWGTATGPTAMASYDAALAEAGIHNYNLVPVSSVVPADVPVEAVGTAPDLGAVGNRLTVVQARATVSGPGRASAGLGWVRGSADDADDDDADRGPGLFYEAAGETGVEDIRERVFEGLAAGQELRDWDFGEERIEAATAPAEPGMYTTAVVVAAYGRSDPIVE